MKRLVGIAIGRRMGHRDTLPPIASHDVPPTDSPLSRENVPCGTFDYPPSPYAKMGMYPASKSGRGGEPLDYPPQSDERLGTDPSAGLGQEMTKEVIVSEGKNIVLEVSGLMVQAGGLETYVSNLVGEKMSNMEGMTDDEVEAIAERVFEDKMPSGYDDPSDHYDMGNYVTSDDVEEAVRDALRDEDSLAHADDLKVTDENVADLTERVIALEAVIAQLRAVFAPATPTTGWQTQEVAI
jgi:hypothetical protein